MAKQKNRIPLGDATQGKTFNNPFAALSNVPAASAGTPPPETRAPAKEAPSTSASPKVGKFDVRAERKGRGGKTVTLVRNLGWSDDALQSLAKDMRHALGCGATVEDDAVLLQGDQTERAREYLKKLRGI